MKWRVPWCGEPKQIACIMWLDSTFDLWRAVTPASHLFGFSPLPPGDQNSGLGRVTVLKNKVLLRA